MLLLFDLMDTVVVDPYHHLIANLLPQGMSFDEWRTWRDRSAFEAFERGEIDEEEYMRRFYLPGIPAAVRKRLVDPRILKAQLYQQIDFVPGIQALLARVSAACPLALGSNYGQWYREVLRLRPELTGLFAVRFFSCELGVRKPERGYYEQVAARLGRQDIAFIDDRSENLVVPASLGWKCHKFRDAATLAAWLESLGCLD